MYMPLFANYFIFVSILLYFQDISSTILLFFTLPFACLLGCRIPFPYKKSSGLTRLRETLIEAIVFGSFSSKATRWCLHQMVDKQIDIRLDTRIQADM